MALSAVVLIACCSIGGVVFVLRRRKLESQPVDAENPQTQRKTIAPEMIAPISTSQEDAPNVTMRYQTLPLRIDDIHIASLPKYVTLPDGFSGAPREKNAYLNFGQHQLLPTSQYANPLAYEQNFDYNRPSAGFVDIKVLENEVQMHKKEEKK